VPPELLRAPRRVYPQSWNSRLPDEAIRRPVGVQATVSYSVSCRMREIGIRAALGAAPARIIAMVLGQALTVIAVGVCLGGLVAVGASAVIAHELVGITPLDPTTSTLASPTILASGLLASFGPAARPARLDPVASIRCD